MLPTPSQNQRNIVNNIDTHNIIVEAVAGSGKTTTILHIASAHKYIDILVLTYNSRLKIETRNKVKQLHLTNIEVHSYHAFCVKYYDNKCYTDSGIYKMLKNNARRKKYFNYDLLIIDEAQDMSPTYYEIVCKIMKEHKVKPKICILGDRYQSIFQFNNADSRFIKYGAQLFDFNDYKWINCSLNVSYRITSQMANFINKCVLNEDRIVACKNNDKVRYLICDIFSGKFGGTETKYMPYEEIKLYLKEYDYDDIFVLTASVKSEITPARILANKLSDDKIPIYVPNNDDEKLDEDVIKGKIVFSTFHQVKGLERKVVITFNFSDSYFTYYKKKSNPHRCPNELYVAITRAKEKLSVIHHYTDDFFKFIRKDNLSNTLKFLQIYTTLIVSSKIRVRKQTRFKTKSYAVTKLTQHLPLDIIQNAMKYLTITQVQKNGSIINIDNKTKQGSFYENVAEITGTAIPSYYEYLNKKTMNIHSVLSKKDYFTQKSTSESDIIYSKYAFDSDDDNDDNDDSEHGDINKNENLTDITNLSIPKLLKIANYFCAYMSGYDYKLYQIHSYEWMSHDNLVLCIKRLTGHINNNARHEIICKYENKTLSQHNKYLHGAIDCIDGTNMWEFKCVRQLKDDHFLQLAIYAYMYHNFIDNYNTTKLKPVQLEIDKIKYSIALANQKCSNHIYKSNDNILINLNGVETLASISCIFQNGNVNVRVNDKVIKIHKNDIIRTTRFDRYKKGLSNKLHRSLESYNALNIYPESYNYFLFNILTDEIYQIECSDNNLKSLVDYLIKSKFDNDHIIPDDEFLDNINKIKSKYVS